MANCTESKKALRAVKTLTQSQTQTYNNFVKAVKAKGFTAALSSEKVETGLKQKKGGATMNELYLFGKTGRPVPPRVWVWSYTNGDAEIEDIADHRGH